MLSLASPKDIISFSFSFNASDRLSDTSPRDVCKVTLASFREELDCFSKAFSSRRAAYLDSSAVFASMILSMSALESNSWRFVSTRIASFSCTAPSKSVCLASRLLVRLATVSPSTLLSSLRRAKLASDSCNMASTSLHLSVDAISRSLATSCAWRCSSSCVESVFIKPSFVSVSNKVCVMRSSFSLRILSLSDWDAS